MSDKFAFCNAGCKYAVYTAKEVDEKLEELKEEIGSSGGGGTGEGVSKEYVDKQDAAVSMGATVKIKELKDDMSAFESRLDSMDAVRSPTWTTVGILGGHGNPKLEEVNEWLKEPWGIMLTNLFDQYDKYMYGENRRFIVTFSLLDDISSNLIFSGYEGQIIEIMSEQTQAAQVCYSHLHDVAGATIYNPISTFKYRILEGNDEQAKWSQWTEVAKVNTFGDNVHIVGHGHVVIQRGVCQVKFTDL